MTGHTFLRNVREHHSLHFGRGPRDDRIYVIYLGPDKARVGWELDPATIREHSWETLSAVLTGKRRPEIMSHLTRIVGYYSNMRNWNPSKLAEARDRARGAYVVPEQRMDVIRHRAHVPTERMTCVV
jgi:hypothetical protein